MVGLSVHREGRSPFPQKLKACVVMGDWLFMFTSACSANNAWVYPHGSVCSSPSNHCGWGVLKGCPESVGVLRSVLRLWGGGCGVLGYPEVMLLWGVLRLIEVS